MKEIAVLIEQLRQACSVALGDLLAQGMPPGVSTGRLLQAAIVAAVEYLTQIEEAKLDATGGPRHRSVDEIVAGNAITWATLDIDDLRREHEMLRRSLETARKQISALVSKLDSDESTATNETEEGS